MGRGKCLGELGHVQFMRFQDTQGRKADPAEISRYLDKAAELYLQKLELMPEDAVSELAITYNGLGAIYSAAGDLGRAILHYRDSIRYYDEQGNVYGASKPRFNVAIALDDAGRPQDALEYARAALRGFETYGESAAADIQDTRQLIEQIQQNL